MANKTVSNLNELTTVSNSDVLLVETATETLKVTKGNLLKEVNEQLNAKSDVTHEHSEYVTEGELNAKGLATESYVQAKIAEASLSGGDVDLSGYATIDFVTQEISSIELAPGPKGDTGAQGPKGDTGAVGPQGPKGEKGEPGTTSWNDLEDKPNLNDYVLVENFNQEIDKTNAQLSEKANKSQIGSPLVASSVSEMIDTTKIYVNTTDGNWYSFNGSQWIIGGVYNSQGINDNSITPQMTTFVRYEDVFTLDGAEIGGINTVGTINTTQTGMKTSALIPVVEGSSVELPGFIKFLCFYNMNGVSLASTHGRLSDLRNEVVTIPVGAHFIRVTWIINHDNADYRDDQSVQVLNINNLKFIPKIKDKSFNKSIIIEDVIDRNDFDDNVYLEYLSEYKILMIYMKTAKKYYLGYNFRYMKADYNASNTSSNYDVWRLRDVKIYTKNSDDTFTKVNDTSLIHSASEWECAIKEVGSSDFVGGSTHGDELLDNIVFMLDGVAYTNVAQISGQKCKELRIIRTSRLYRADTNSATKIATHYVDYLFKNNEIIIDQKVNWLVDTTCGISYLTMLGAKRSDSGVQITSSALKDGEGVIYDVSQDNYSNGAFDTLKGCKKAFLWNDSKRGFKTSMSVEVLDSNSFKNANFKFDNRADYNKFYFDHCGNNFEVKIGDVWYNKAKYKIDFIGFF